MERIDGIFHCAEHHIGGKRRKDDVFADFRRLFNGRSAESGYIDGQFFLDGFRRQFNFRKVEKFSLMGNSPVLPCLLDDLQTFEKDFPAFIKLISNTSYSRLSYPRPAAKWLPLLNRSSSAYSSSQSDRMAGGKQNTRSQFNSFCFCRNMKHGEGRTPNTLK